MSERAEGAAATPGLTGCGSRIVQVHLTRQCNLRCRHCYSASGPDVTEAIEPDALLAAIPVLAAEGYNVLGCSGGEPLLYGRLADVLRRARQHGMTTTVTSNGMLLGDAHKASADEIDLLALSLDGVPESHVRMRDNRHAFAGLERGVAWARERGLRFGFIFTLTLYNLDELEWVMDYAIAQGAALLQIHALDDVGHAKRWLADAVPDDEERSAALLHAVSLAEERGNRIQVQIDIAATELIAERAATILPPVPPDRDPGTVPLADLLNPLVIGADGALLPLQYHENSRFRLGRVDDDNLPEVLAEWKRRRYPALHEVCTRALASATRGDQTTVDVYRLLTDAANAATVGPAG